MKTRFSTLDIIAILPELKSKICTGWRVNQVYDCDQKTYLFKLNKSITQMRKDDDPVNVHDETANKMNFIIESGSRMHTTDFDWPRSHAPSQFATKLRKHIRNKRIEDIKQVGIDRLVDVQFGSSLHANHLLVELYDRGNLVLTDFEYRIIAILRWRKPTTTVGNSVQAAPTTTGDSEDFRPGQIYPLERSRKLEDIELLTEEKIVELLNNSKIILGSTNNRKKQNKLKQSIDEGSLEINLKDLLNPCVVYGSSLLEDKLLKYLREEQGDLKRSVIRIKLDEKKGLDQEEVSKYAKSIKAALDEADTVLRAVKDRKNSPGFLIQKMRAPDPEPKYKLSTPKRENQPEKVKKPAESLKTNIDFFPIKSCAERRLEQEDNLMIEELESFDKTVDIYFHNMESQKIDSKAFNAEKEAMKKLENFKLVQEKRLEDLARTQKDDEEKARLIELNSDKVENALLIIRSMLAGQVSWADIWNTIKEAQKMKDPIASLITAVKFDRNEFTMKLSDPYEGESEAEKDEQSVSGSGNRKGAGPKYRSVDIDVGLSAYANARRFFVKRRAAVHKEKKTIEVSKKALKNVERQTKEMLKEVVVKTNISKSRKRYWFENFFWFISSDGYLVVAGRDAEQNDLLVKRYMKKRDIYVHADLHGASSVIVKNEFSDPIPPKTITEAGTMAVCYSSAWDAKMATTAYWVYPNQVSKSAPTGEYLSVGAFMIRGKKNFLPLANLVLGFGFLFRLDEESIERKKEERKARELDNGKHSSANLPQGDQQESGADDDDGDESDEVGDGDGDGESLSDSGGESAPDSATLPVVDQSKADDRRQGDAEEVNGEDQAPDDGEEDYDSDEEDETQVTAEYRLTDTLTESPKIDDILLYGIPMCGPYSAMHNFKYKVKVIPGANKRGKAAKACLGMFLHDKNSTQREKDLLRALKDQDYARNIPNKVKISSTNLKTITKRRPKKSEVRLPVS